jgi:sec-independent protein translocase protein TatC
MLKSRGNAFGEMSFIDHIEDLRWHIIRALSVLVLASMFVFFNIEWIFDNIILGPAHNDFITYRIMCRAGVLLHLPGLCMQDMNMQFQNTVMSGQFMMSFSMSFMLGFIFSFPYILYEIWRFIMPALKEKEITAARGIIFWSSLLFFLGVCFAYFLIAPYTINFFSNYQLSPSFKNIITITSYNDTIGDLVLGMGMVFQLPVAVYFLSRASILNPTIMKAKRNYAVVVILVLAAVITPPDWLSLWFVAVPLLILYELSIKISGRVQKAIS